MKTTICIMAAIIMFTTGYSMQVHAQTETYSEITFYVR